MSEFEKKLKSLNHTDLEGVPNIKINDICFYLCLEGKSIQYDVIAIRSFNMTNLMDNKLFLVYKSGSQGLWRLGVQINGIEEYFEKFSDYSITTLIHIELQNFLEQHSGKLPNINFLYIHQLFLFNYGVLDLDTELEKQAKKDNISIYDEYTFKYEKYFKHMENVVKNYKDRKISDIKLREKINAFMPHVNTNVHISRIRNLYYKTFLNFISSELKRIETTYKLDYDRLKYTLDIQRQYNSVGKEIFDLFKHIEHTFLANPCVITNDSIKEKFINAVSELKSVVNNDIYEKLYTNINTILEDVTKSAIKYKATLHNKNKYENKICLYGIFKIFNIILSTFFDAYKMDGTSYQINGKKFKVGKDEPFKLYDSEISPITYSQNYIRMRKIKNNEYTLLDSPFNIHKIKLYFKKDVLLTPVAKDNSFVLYYGDYTITDVLYKIPIAIYPFNNNINDLGLPEKYISMQLYSGKPYDYKNQVCDLQHEIVKIVATDDAVYKFCGDYYDNIWPFSLGELPKDKAIDDSVVIINSPLNEAIDTLSRNSVGSLDQSISAISRNSYDASGSNLSHNNTFKYTNPLQLLQKSVIAHNIKPKVKKYSKKQINKSMQYTNPRLLKRKTRLQRNRAK